MLGALPTLFEACAPHNDPTVTGPVKGIILLCNTIGLFQPIPWHTAVYKKPSSDFEFITPL